MIHKILRKYKGKRVSIHLDSTPVRDHQVLMYIEFSKNKIKSTIRVAENIYIDYDSKQKIVGVEII